MCLRDFVVIFWAFWSQLELCCWIRRLYSQWTTITIPISNKQRQECFPERRAQRVVGRKNNTFVSGQVMLYFIQKNVMVVCHICSTRLQLLLSSWLVFRMLSLPSVARLQLQLSSRQARAKWQNLFAGETPSAGWDSVCGFPHLFVWKIITGLRASQGPASFTKENDSPIDSRID